MILYTNGCSFTFGSEMKNPQHDAWPYVLGEKLHWITINEALPAGSVIRVYRKTLNFIFQNLEKKDKLFIIICWPPKVRSEGYYNKIIRLKLSKKELFKSDFDFNHMIRTFFNLTQQTISCFINSVFIQFQLHTILKSYSIPHIFFETTSKDIIIFNKNNFKNKQYIKNILLIKEKEICNKNIILKNSSFESFTCENNYLVGPEKHPLEEAHIQIANILYDKIQKDFSKVFSK